MNKLCNRYNKIIFDKYRDYVKSVIIYGSNIYNSSSSDLDVCIIIDKYSKSIIDNMITDTIKFHKDNNLKIDEEIPFTNKLVYTTEEVLDALENPPFYKNDKVVINKIVKNKRFLSSKEMKQRLLLNILTTDHLTTGESTTEYENRAYDIIIKVITDYYNLEKPTITELLNCMYVNKYTKDEGEMYLGYKKNYKEKEDYLISKLKKYTVIDLSKNTNPYFPSENIKNALKEGIEHIDCYPDVNEEEQAKTLGKYFKISAKNVCFSKGTLGGFELILEHLKPKKVGFLTPTFWGMPLLAKKYGAKLINEPIKDNYSLKQINELAKKTDMLYICNPNNPTLDYIDKKNLLKLISNNKNCHFVIDETLLAFSDMYKKDSLYKEASKYSNLSVIMSFSKILSIAGLRMSPLFSNEKLISKIKQKTLIYSSCIINKYIIDEICKEYFNIDRSVFSNNFKNFISSLDKKYIESITNINVSFILIKFIDIVDVPKLLKYLEKNNFIIANISEIYPDLGSNYVRISIGKDEDLQTLGSLINKYFYENDYNSFAINWEILAF